MAGLEQKDLREHNIKKIFNCINNNKGVSRVHIVKNTKLSKATVSTLVDHLMRMQIVYECGVGEKDTSGRKPIILHTNKEYAQIMCVSLNPYHLVYSLFDLHYNEIETFKAEIKYTDNFFENILTHIKNKSLFIDPKKLIGICFSVPATINNKTGEVNSSVLDLPKKTNIFDWKNNVFENVPIVVGNVSAARVYAERKFESHEQTQNLFYITMNEGVGAGIMVNGSVFRGADGFAGEFGHMSIDKTGIPCKCGKAGCLEASLNEVVLSEKCNCENFTQIGTCLMQNNQNVINKMQQAAEDLTFGINNMIAIFNPEKIILGGGIEKTGQIFLDMIKKRVQVPCVPTNDEQSPIVAYTKLYERAENLGMARYFIDTMYKISIPTQDKMYIL